METNERAEDGHQSEGCKGRKWCVFMLGGESYEGRSVVVQKMVGE